MTKIHLKPAPGIQVRHPDTRQFLAAEGEEVDLSSYWVRRKNAGDVVEFTPAKPVAAPAAAANSNKNKTPEE